MAQCNVATACSQLPQISCGLRGWVCRSPERQPEARVLLVGGGTCRLPVPAMAAKESLYQGILHWALTATGN